MLLSLWNSNSMLNAFLKISKMKKGIKKRKKSLILHDWESSEHKNWKNMKRRTITCFGDRTSGTFLIIALVSWMKITRSYGPITL